MERQRRAQRDQAGEVRPVEPAPGAHPLSHVARARARLRGQRRRDLSRERRRAGRPLRSSIYAAGEIAHLSYDAQMTHRPEGHAVERCGCAPIAPIPTAICSGRRRPTHFGVGDVEGFDSKLTGTVRVRPRRGHHQPPADTRRPRSTALASKATCRPAGKPRSTATTSCSALPRRRPTIAMCLMMCSFSTARTGSGSSFTGRKGRSGRARS